MTITRDEPHQLEATPSVGHIGFYWTLRTVTPIDDTPQVRLWTGYSWLETGSEVHIHPDECRVVSVEIEPPEL